ncbi:hypothetical protein PG994_009556 [Apiospora phragmitis]|uniref:Uncharacterized protein n=1 Tax=Apiospora phragmitis TaxID=2905665 RepID=A0ABR1U6I0_9PEZI
MRARHDSDSVLSRGIGIIIFIFFFIFITETQEALQARHSELGGIPAAARVGGAARQVPLSPCPFEQRGGYWNCCWCGKEWNDQGGAAAS